MEDDEISCASLNYVMMADHAYDADYHDYYNCDALSQTCGLGLGLCNVCPPPTKNDGEDEEKWGHDYAHCFNQRMCSICLDEYKILKRLCVLPYQQTFHCDCTFPRLTEGDQPVPYAR